MIQTDFCYHLQLQLVDGSVMMSHRHTGFKQEQTSRVVRNSLYLSKVVQWRKETLEKVKSVSSEWRHALYLIGVHEQHMSMCTCVLLQLGVEAILIRGDCDVDVRHECHGCDVIVVTNVTLKILNTLHRLSNTPLTSYIRFADEVTSHPLNFVPCTCAFSDINVNLRCLRTISLRVFSSAFHLKLLQTAF